jgi:hypothetical protein
MIEMAMEHKVGTRAIIQVIGAPIAFLSLFAFAIYTSVGISAVCYDLGLSELSTTFIGMAFYALLSAAVGAVVWKVCFPWWEKQAPERKEQIQELLNAF